MVYIIVAVSVAIVAMVSIGVLLSVGVYPDSADRGDIERLARSFGSNSRRKSIPHKIVKKSLTGCFSYLKHGNFRLKAYENWLYDNYYKITNFLHSVKGLKKPTLLLSEGLPRIYLLARWCTSTNDGKLNEHTLSSVLDEFNRNGYLLYDELVTLKSACEYCLVEYLSIYASRSLTFRKNYEIGSKDAYCGKISWSLLSSYGYLDGFYKNANGNQAEYLKTACEENGIDFLAKMDELEAKESEYALKVENAIKSLLSLQTWLTDEFLLSVSKVNAYLDSAKGVFYSRNSIATKMEYLRLISKKAKRGKELAAAKRFADRASRENVDLYLLLVGRLYSPKWYGVLGSFRFLLSIFLSVLTFFIGKSYTVSILLLPIFYRFIGSIGVKTVSKPRYFVPRVEKSEKKALIVISSLVHCQKDAKRASERAQTVKHANPEFDVCLLVDLKDSSTEKDESDEGVISVLSESSEYSLMVRKRALVNGRYTAWEKKRGAILTLNEYLLGKSDGFRYKSGKLGRYEYVIALDEDSDLIYANRAVEAMEHPYFSRYCVMSFASACSFYGIKTGYARLFSHKSGYDGRCFSVANDFFGYGNYTGKGIYRLSDFYEQTTNAFEDERILSHDFIEGAISGCINGDITVYENPPTSFAQDLNRECRWIRGDVQLLPFLGKYRKNRGGVKERNDLGVVNKLHILDGIIRPVALVFKFAATLFAIKTPYMLPFIFAEEIAELIIVAFSFVRSPKAGLSCVLRVVYKIAVLPTVALFTAYSVVVTLIRLIRKKNLLVWKTFSHSQTDEISPLFNFFSASVVLAMGVIFFSPAYFAFALLFFIGCVLMGNGKAKEDEVKSNVVHCFMPIIEATGRYFQKYLAPSYGYLIPDNYSEETQRLALRTSPTNIGFSLASTVCLYKTGFITKSRFHEYVDGIMEKIQALPKYKGHLYNWYSVPDGKVLFPGYVSTVDSGNLCACLIFALPYLGANADTARRFLREIDFDFLYDTNRGLLKTGYDSNSARLDEGCYDLVASESLLTYLFCIAYGKIPASSASSLDYSMVQNKGKAFQSWTGGSFEYLMPALFVDFPEDCALQASIKTAIKAQRAQALPFWGTSECQYDEFDDSGNRKYKAFGIDSLAYNAQKTNVRAPYASILSARYAGGEVMKNISLMKSVGAYGEMGFYESYDNKPIKTYMAHHQGMIICALTDYVLGGANSREFTSNPHVRAGLLYFLACGEGNVVVRDKIVGKKKTEHKKHAPIYDINSFYSQSYCFCTSLKGEGKAYFSSSCVYNSGYDVLLSFEGKTGFLTKGATVTQRRDGTQYKTETSRYEAVVETTVARGFCGEMRKVKIYNKTEREQSFIVGFWVNPVLGDEEAYLAHKTYEKMFIATTKGDGKAQASKGDVYCCLTVSGNDTLSEVDRGLLLRQTESKTVVDGVLFTASRISVPAHSERTVYSALVLAKNQAALQSSLNVVCKNEEDEFEKSARVVKSVSARANNLISACRNAKRPDVEGVDYPCVTVEIRKDGAVYGLEEHLKDIALASRFTDGISVCIIYTESSEYARGTFNKLEQIVRRAVWGVRGNIQVAYLERSKDEKAIEEIKRCAIKPINHTPVFAEKTASPISPSAPLRSKEILLATDIGGFTSEGYYIDKLPPKAWSNVVSNGKVGFVTTESGGGFTFYSNCREEKITKFSFDPLLDGASEGIVLAEGGTVWSATRNPSGKEGEWYCEHGFGKSEYVHSYNGITVKQKVGVAGNSKVFVITIRNDREETSSLNLTAFARLVLGDFEYKTNKNLRFSHNENAVKAVNTKNGVSATLACSHPIISHSFSFDEISAITGEIVKTTDLSEEKKGDSLILTTSVTLMPSKEKKVVFTLGGIANPDFTVAENAMEEFAESMKKLSLIEINTSSSLDFIFRWSAYQALSSRFYARCGFYQVGGAYGFRDQLQDCLCLVYCKPELVREHILYCSQRQFESGDVLHWWHHPYFGVRTRISDNKLFLPYVVARYIKITGDAKILNEKTPFLKDRAFDKVLCDNFEPTAYTETVLEHIQRAFRSCRFAPNGLVLMGDGDWNDAMNTAGSNGEGSSVWLSMFLYLTIKECLDFLPHREAYLKTMKKLRSSVDKAFNGKSYARLVRDNGKPLGYDDGFIDLITQAFAVISGVAIGDKGEIAMDSAKRLVDMKTGIVKLLEPAFDKSTDVGSIGKYPKGVRENGGQYTHGALWYIIALYMLGKKNEAYEVLERILPIYHSMEGRSRIYKLEPYVVAADIYSHEGVGEGGWSWYTGSASWTYVTIVEYMLGICKRGKTLTFCPNLPDKIKHATIKTFFDGIRMEINVDNSGEGEWHAYYDGVRYETCSIEICTENNNRKFELRRG